MTSVWRIGYCPSPVPDPKTLLRLLGHGSTLGSGRWHTQSPLQVVYSGSSRALCQLEKRVHSNGANPRNQALIRLDLPAASRLDDVSALGLPTDWRANLSATQAIGDAWIALVRNLGLWVPSFVEPAERNLLLNPAHPDYPAIELFIERHPFEFDPRLF